LNTNYKILLATILVIIVALELALRCMGVADTFAEKSGLPDNSLFDQQISNPYRLIRFNENYTNQTGDFSYKHFIGSHGFIGESPGSKVSRYRIVVFGDSFTEGVGAFSPDSSFPALLQNVLNVNSDTGKYEVLNFGNAGSDVVFEAKYLTDSTLRFHPDVVIMTFNNTDISDIIQWGGTERFLADGIARSKSAPWFKWLYDSSRIARLIIANALKYDSELLLTKQQLEIATAEARNVVVETATRANDFCKVHQIKFMFLLLPFYSDLANPAVSNDSKIYFNRLQQTISNQGVHCVNLYQPMSEVIKPNNFEQYSWWIHDGHYKNKGYELIARIVADSLQLPQPTTTSGN